jgi:lipopolysaccharide/colanic/teichoic acid biosynthesis glycosyltransferase
MFHRLLIRWTDVLLSGLGLVLLTPFLILISLWVRLGSAGPVIYRQQRIGRGAVPFTLLKFRTMYPDADKKGLITVGSRDPRITPAGAFLRKWKLDELPQLWNVFRGDMSLVGPRPEVPRYVDLYTPEQRKVLSVRPGITDKASIVYADENDRLSKAGDPEAHYQQVILPDKIRLNMEFIRRPTFGHYLRILWLTFSHVFLGSSLRE